MPGPLGIGSKQPKFMLALCFSAVNPLIDNGDGITVNQLRKIIGRIPPTDSEGNEARVFAVCGNMHTAPIKIATLDEDGDLLLVPDFWQEVMEDLGSWEEFSSDD